MSADVRQLDQMVGDNSLPDPAVRIGTYVWLRDDGSGVELPFDAVAQILHGFPGRDKIRAALRSLELTGYVERIAGGRGRSDRFRWRGGHQLSMGLQPHPNEKLESGSSPTLNLGVGSSPTLSEHRGGLQPNSKGPVVVVGESSSSSSRKYGIEPKVEETIEGSDLNGLRSPLRDYLADRVMGTRQWGYIQTIRTWFDGGVGAPRGLHKLGPREQRLVVANALNELLQHTTEEEKTMYRSSRGRAGSTDVLRAKVEFLLRRSQDGGAQSGAAPRGSFDDEG